MKFGKDKRNTIIWYLHKNQMIAPRIF